MASLGVSDITAILKELYPDGVPKDLWYKRSPFLAKIRKDTEGYGEQIKVPIRYGSPQGRSATFASGRANMTASKYKAFNLTTVNDYGFAQIDGEAIDRSKKDKQSFIRGLQKEIEGAMRTLKRSCTHAIFRDGTGSMGTASFSTTRATLVNPTDIVFFELGQELVCWDNSSSTVRAGSATVTAVDRVNGYVDTDSNWSAQITSPTTGDSLMVVGDLNNKIKGLEAWNPASNPGATAFFGVDRSDDPIRLGGVRADYSARPIEEAIIDALELVGREGGDPDLIVMHTTDFANLEKALRGKVVYGTMEAYDAPQITFRTIKIAEGIEVVADYNAQPNVMRVLQSDTWTLYSLGDVPKMLDNDGQAMLRTVTADSVEVQLVYRAQLGCDAPGWNGRFVIGT